MTADPKDQEKAGVAAHAGDDVSHQDGEPGALPAHAEASTTDKRESAIPWAADPPLPYDDAPPLPDEPTPDQEDDGWEPTWEPTAKAWYFYNRRTGASQWENPRVPEATALSHGPYDRFANFYHFLCPCPA
jgi:hypothetical protein